MVHTTQTYYYGIPYSTILYYLNYAVICAWSPLQITVSKLSRLICIYVLAVLYFYVWNRQYCVIFVLTNSIDEFIVFITNECTLYIVQRYILILINNYTYITWI